VRLRPLRKPGLKILYLVIGIGGLLLLLYLQPSCVVKQQLGIVCPSCGLTRAWLSVLRLDFRSAFVSHAMFWVIPVVGFYILFDMRPFCNDKINYGILCGMSMVFILYFILRLILHI